MTSNTSTVRTVRTVRALHTGTGRHRADRPTLRVVGDRRAWLNLAALLAALLTVWLTLAGLLTYANADTPQYPASETGTSAPYVAPVRVYPNLGMDMPHRPEFVAEDDERFDCRIDGDQVCGERNPGGYAPGYYGI